MFAVLTVAARIESVFFNDFKVTSDFFRDRGWILIHFPGDLFE